MLNALKPRVGPWLPKLVRTYKYQSFKSSRTPWTLQRIQRPALITVGVGLVIYVANLEETPVSKRKRFMIVPRWLEKQVGNAGYQQTMAQFGRQCLPEHHPDVIKVKQIMSRLIRVSGMENEDIEWKVHVIGGNYPPNAFVLPGGKVFVFQSMLPICANDDGLATVLSHETAHQVCRHTAESLSKRPLYIALGLALYSITGSSSIEGLIINLGLQLPASRNMEREADYVGVLMMARACFRPRESVSLWERMLQAQRRGGGHVPEFLSTHPANESRISAIQEYLGQAESIREQNCAPSKWWS